MTVCLSLARKQDRHGFYNPHFSCKSWSPSAGFHAPHQPPVWHLSGFGWYLSDKVSFQHQEVSASVQFYEPIWFKQEGSIQFPNNQTTNGHGKSQWEIPTSRERLHCRWYFMSQRVLKRNLSVVSWNANRISSRLPELFEFMTSCSNPLCFSLRRRTWPRLDDFDCSPMCAIGMIDEC